MHRHCAFIMHSDKNVCRVECFLISMPAEMPIYHLCFCQGCVTLYYILPPPSTAMPTAIGRGVRMGQTIQTPLQTAYVTAHARSAHCDQFPRSAFIFRIRVVMQDHPGTAYPQGSVTQKTDCGSEFLFWCWEWAQTRVWRGDNSCDPCSETQRALPCPSLWDTLQGEETDNGHKVRQGLCWRTNLLRTQ